MTFWEEFASFETDAEIEEYEEASRISDKDNGEYRCVTVGGEGGRHLLETPNLGDTGWAKVCTVTWGENNVQELSDEIANELPDDYRVVFVYDEDLYKIERFYD